MSESLRVTNHPFIEYLAGRIVREVTALKNWIIFVYGKHLLLLKTRTISSLGEEWEGSNQHAASSESSNNHLQLF